jgi:hypothetical protein
MFGLKINYQKIEIMAVGSSKEESSYIANMLNCKVGGLPIKYLGFLSLIVNFLPQFDVCWVETGKRLLLG